MVQSLDRMKLTITHVPTNNTVEFPAYLEMFSDAYTSQWNSEDVYGRMDPISTFINTRRALSLAWNVPAESYEDARQNLLKVNELMSYLYPLYEEESSGATAINQSPLLRISFGNLIRDAKTGQGLLGYANGFTFDPALEFGMFHNLANNKEGVEYYPKTFRLNTEFNVLHEHSLGFKRSNKEGTRFSFRDEKLKDDFSNYPYATNLPIKQTRTNRGTPAAKAEEGSPQNPVAAAQADKALTRKS